MAVHAVDPTDDEEPSGQLAHVKDAATEENVFAAHWLHTEAPVLEYAPAEQVMQVEALAAEKEPPLQLVQALLPAALENKPALQPVHTVAPMPE